jgi:predicted amidohydrolase
MMALTLHVAAAQIHSGGGVEDTLQRLERQVASAAAVGVEVILFSECVLHGFDYDFTMESVRSLAEPVSGPTCSQVVKMAKRYKVAILAGFFERDADAMYNSHLVARPDGSRTVQRKHALTEGELQAGLARGPAERTIFTFNGVRTAIIVCSDCSIEGLHDKLRKQNVMYRFCPTAGGGKIADCLHEEDLRTPTGRRRYEENRPRVFITNAILDETKCPHTGFTAANALGPVGRQTCHQGHCMIVDNDRVMRAQIPGTIVLEHMQDQMIHAQLNFK